MDFSRQIKSQSWSDDYELIAEGGGQKSGPMKCVGIFL